MPRSSKKSRLRDAYRKLAEDLHNSLFATEEQRQAVSASLHQLHVAVFESTR